MSFSHWFLLYGRRSECRDISTPVSSRRCCGLTCWCLWHDPPQTGRITSRVRHRFFGVWCRREPISSGAPLLLDIFDQAARRKVPFQCRYDARARGTKSKPYLAFHEFPFLLPIYPALARGGRNPPRCTSPPFPVRAVAPGKGCFTFTACLWYLMGPKTSKHPLPTRARVYPRLTTDGRGRGVAHFPLSYISLTRNITRVRSPFGCHRRCEFMRWQLSNKKPSMVARTNMTLRKFIFCTPLEKIIYHASRFVRALRDLRSVSPQRF